MVITLLPFFTNASWKILYSSKSKLLLAFWTIVSFLRRFAHLTQVISADFVFIHREATPLGPPVFEWIIAKVLRKKIVYDFDDAIWLTDRTTEPILSSWLKWRSKVANICRWSHITTCGNQFLADFALGHTDRVRLIPTTIDTSLHHNRELYSASPGRDRISIGWTGSHSTLVYLLELVPVLEVIANRFRRVEFLVIADRDPQIPVSNIRFFQWKKETEIEDLMLFDIGIMPLTDNDWAKGKCGFKALQYMSLGIPSVISPVGANKVILTHGKEGYHASNESQWIEYLSRLIENPALRKQMGSNGRETVNGRYSVDAITPEFLSLFE